MQQQQQQQHETASPPASKKRRRASPIAAPPQPLAGGSGRVVHARARGRRRESGTGDEDDGEIDEMLVALGIPDSDKKKKKKTQQQQQREARAAEVIELITPPRASSRAIAARSGARSVVSLDDDDVSESARAAADDRGERRRESIVDLTSPDSTAAVLETVLAETSSSTYTVEAAVVAAGVTVQRARRTILVTTSEVDATHELHLPASPVLSEERARPAARLPSTPQTPSSDRECDLMLEDLMLTRPLAERIAAARGRESNSIRSGAGAVVSGADRDNDRGEQNATSGEDRELTIAQGGGFLYSSITTTTRATVDRQDQGPTRSTSSVASASETLDFRMSESHYSESVILSRSTASGVYEGPVCPVDVRPEAAAAGTPQKKARCSKAPGSKREPVVAVVKMERTLDDSEAGQVLKKALQTHVYNNKPLVFELGVAFDCMHSNVIQWERRETVIDRSNGTKSARNAFASSAPSVCRFLSMAIYFQAEEFIQLLEQGSYSEVRSIMQFLKKDLQAQATRLQQRQSRFHGDGGEPGEIQLSTFLIIEGMDKCLINRKKKKKQTTSTTTAAEPAVQAPQLSFSDIHEMSFQLFMETETHTKFTVDLDGTASYVAMLTREIVIAAAKKTAQEDFLESVPRLHSFRVTSTGATMNTFANSWLRMLQMIPGVSEDKAQSILDHFPTFSSLMLAYSDPSVSQAAKEDLLASKLPGKNVGRAISKRIFNVFCVDDPEAFI